MRRRLHLLWLFSMCGAALVVPMQARAQSAPAASASAPAGAGAGRPGTEGLVAERQRLRADLARVQTEIDQLKKGDRGLRADYQLRARMADAEAIARRLTDLDEQIRARSPGGAPRPLSSVGEAPVASPTDGPQELDAKADILTDQAHRVLAQAAALKTRIDQVRGRRELRRRAHQLESDPFAPLEGSKRRLLTSNPAQAQHGGEVPGTTNAPTVTDSGGPRTGAPPPAGNLGAATPAVPPSTSTPVSSGDVSSKSAAPAVQVHDQLDPNTTAAVRKTGAANGGGVVSNDLDAMEKELAALNARAQHLETQAQALRAKARAR
jgi:hypothetical protein